MLSTKTDIAVKKLKQAENYKRWYSRPINKKKQSKNSKIFQTIARETQKQLKSKVDKLSAELKSIKEDYAQTVSIFYGEFYDVTFVILGAGKYSENVKFFSSK